MGSVDVGKNATAASSPQYASNSLTLHARMRVAPNLGSPDGRLGHVRVLKTVETDATS